MQGSNTFVFAENMKNSKRKKIAFHISPFHYMCNVSSLSLVHEHWKANLNLELQTTVSKSFLTSFFFSPS